MLRMCGFEREREREREGGKEREMDGDGIFSMRIRSVCSIAVPHRVVERLLSAKSQP